MVPAGDYVCLDGWLDGPARKVYAWISMDEVKSSARQLNSMRQMRAAFGLPVHNEAIAPWLRYWDSISSDQRVALRRMDLTEIPEDFPRPTQPVGEEA